VLAAGDRRESARPREREVAASGDRRESARPREREVARPCALAVALRERISGHQRAIFKAPRKTDAKPIKTYENPGETFLHLYKTYAKPIKTCIKLMRFLMTQAIILRLGPNLVPGARRVDSSHGPEGVGPSS